MINDAKLAFDIKKDNIDLSNLDLLDEWFI